MCIYFHFIRARGSGHCQVRSSCWCRSYETWKRTSEDDFLRWFPSVIWTYSINARQLEGEICAWNLNDSDAENLTVDVNFKVQDWVYDWRSSILFQVWSVVRLHTAYSCHCKLHSPIFFFSRYLHMYILLPVSVGGKHCPQTQFWYSILVVSLARNPDKSWLLREVTR